MERSNPISRKRQLFWGVIASVVLADAFTKVLAVDVLIPGYPHAILGEFFRMRLVYNPGAAFGLHVGRYSREIFSALSVAALVLMGQMYRSTRAGDRVRTLALALVCSGALGNLIDRAKSGRGVIDFVDVGLGVHRWPTFNVADMAITCGAVALAMVLWREDALAVAQARTDAFVSEMEASRVELPLAPVSEPDAPLRG
jgi:signal peptidase II